MTRRILISVVGFSLWLTLSCESVFGDARQIDDYHWEGVDRIVAIGDLHGDYDNYIATLRAAGLIDKKGKWSGGKTHLVQTGDVPDRGPDTRKIIEHITGLAKQAKRKGGRVHSLIGNHEAMDVYGDLRYVSAGEYEAFVTRKSEALRDRYFELWMQNLEKLDPQGFAELPPDFQEQWYAEHPLGWVEHRQAWDPAWKSDGEYAKWVLGNPVVIQINDVLFLHGGLSGFYCGNTLEWFTDRVHQQLEHFDPAVPGVVEDEYGPLWYRGLSGVEPEAAPESVDAVLQHHQAHRIVVGHTPTSGVIWPMYGGRVVMIDTGISKVYGGYVGYLEITPEGVFAGYPGGRLPLPGNDEDRVAYLEQVIAMDPDNPHLKQRLERLQAPPEPAADAGEKVGAAVDSEPVEGGAPVQEVPPAPELPVVPICGTAQ